MERWICPTDRQLALRAKLGTGWSYFTNRTNNNHDRGVTAEEHQHIAETLKRKEMCDKIEMERIGHMVLHLQNIKRKQLAKSSHDCHICGHIVSFFSATFSNKVCEICGLSTCEHCLSNVMSATSSSEFVESTSQVNESLARGLASLLSFPGNESNSNIKICKYCFEIREIWKRSGAWQKEELPEFKLPQINNICLHPETCTKVLINNHSATIDSASWETYHKLPRWMTIDEKDLKDSEEKNSTEPVFENFSFNPFDEEMNEHSTDISPIVNSTQYKIGTINNQNENVQAKWHNEEPPVGSVFWSQDSVNKPKKKCKEENLGILNYRIFHNSTLSQLAITVIGAKNLKSMDINGLSDPYVKCNMFPGNIHRTKLRTKTCYKTLNPIWNETLIYHGISRIDMDNKTLRLAVLDEDKFGFDWIGEYRLFLPDLNSDEEYNFSHQLISRQSIAKGSDDSVDHERGKILLALFYDNRNSTLRVTIIRCAELAPMDSNGFSDPFCKIYLKPDKQRITKRKTQTKKMTLNPYFNEEFIIDVDPNWCKEKILEISVWDYDRGPKNDFIGCVKFHSLAKGDRGRMWRKISENPCKSFEGWFILYADLGDVG